MGCPERKSIEPIALCAGTGQVSGLQKFIAVAPWQYDDVQAEIQATFAEQLAPSAARTPIGIVGVIDESAFAKKGTKSAGVARQHNGRLGKEDNCQVGVFLIGVTPAGVALLDHQLYLPASWYEGDSAAARRAEAHIPERPAVPDQARDRRRVGPQRRRAGDRGVGLDHGRRGVRQERGPARRVWSDWTSAT